MRFIPVAAEVSQPLHRSAMKYAVTERYIAPFQRTYFAYAQSGQQRKQRSDSTDRLLPRMRDSRSVCAAPRATARASRAAAPSDRQYLRRGSSVPVPRYSAVSSAAAEDITHRFCRKPVAMQQVVCKLLRQRRGQLRPRYPPSRGLMYFSDTPVYLTWVDSLTLLRFGLSHSSQ